MSLGLLVGAGCSSNFDTDDLPGDGSPGGSTVDGGGTPGGGDGGSGGTDGGGGGGNDGGGGGGNDAGGGGTPDAGGGTPDAGGGTPDAGGGGDCGDENEACCPPMNTDSCNDDFLECQGGTCEACGDALGAPCCETEPACSGLLGLTCGVLNLCTGI